MPRTMIATQELAFEGNAAITYNASDQPNGMKFVADGRTLLVVKNTSGSNKVLTLIDVAAANGRFAATAKKSITIFTATERVIGPLPSEGWAQPSGADQGAVQFDLDVGTGVTIGCVRINQT